MQEKDNTMVLTSISNLMNTNLLGIIEKDIPYKSVYEYKKQSKKKFRDRVYTLELTLSGMLYQAAQDDKSEQNAVLAISKYHNERKGAIKNQEEKILKAALNNQKSRKRGRPKRIIPKVQKSKLQPISLNTASYDEARKRMPGIVMKNTFIETTKWFKAENQSDNQKWHGRDVYVTDGTTFKTMDTPELRKYFDVPSNPNPPPLPVGKLQGLINLYGGGIVDTVVDIYGSSEHQMMKKLYPSIAKGTVILGDDLYSSYGHMAYCQHLEIDIITQGKHRRKEQVIRQISKDEQIVAWTASRKPAWYDKTDHLPVKIQLRKIIYTNPKKTNKKCALYTTLLNEKEFPAVDIIALYLARWEIELSFLQIKTILKMEYLRGKTVEMIFKEIYAHLILYNLLRKIIKQSCSGQIGAFSPISEQIQVGDSMVKGPYVDKLGRSYARWNAGKRNISNS